MTSSKNPRFNHFSAGASNIPATENTNGRFFTCLSHISPSRQKWRPLLARPSQQLQLSLKLTGLTRLNITAGPPPHPAL
ncbi:uncharacterized protein O3C94_018216 isoform 2-T2 [Discoglossus pictus]